MHHGFKHPHSGDQFTADDERLIGTGNPPTAPGPIGHGRIPLTPVALTDAQAKAARKAHDAHELKDRNGLRVFPEHKPPAPDPA